MKNLLWFCLLSLVPYFVSGQVIPPERTVNWSQAGYSGALPSPSTFVNVLDFGAVGDGVTNNVTAVTNAMNSLSGNPGVVFFPSGTYLFNSYLNIPNNVVLRGLSSTLSKLKFNFSGTNTVCINIAGTQPSSFVPVSSGYTSGSSTITVSNPAGFAAGDYIEIRETNGSWDTEPATWAAYAVGQIIRLTGVSGNELLLEEPLRITYEASLNPEVGKLTPKKNVGIETLGIERVDDAPTGGPSNINISLAANCWIRGVESNKSVGAHIMVGRSTNIEITGCYIHHAFTYTGSNNRGYGITLNTHAGSCLIENNIFRYLRHAMMVKVGANGNVFGYNYSIEPNRSEFPTNWAADISFHGHYAYSNLFEGNIAQNIIFDHEWGPAGPYNTVFRNRAELYGIIMTSSSNPTNNQNIVGNEVTNNGFAMGNYTITGSGHFQYGNNVKGTIIPSGTTTLDDESYYYTSKPPFWNVTMNWPTIGIPNTINTGTIQAKLRYQNAHYTYLLPVVSAGDDVTINEGESTILNGSLMGGIPTYAYSWTPTTGLSNPAIMNPVATPLATTTYTLTVTDMYGVVDSDEVTVTVLPAFQPVVTDLKVFLEGPFNGSGMNTNIRALPDFPLSQPFNVSPWNYTGTESVLTVPADAVDWVLLELRETAGSASTATSATMVARMACFLLSDGTISETDGISLPEFGITVNDDLYAVIWHRNHIGIMSANPLTESGGLYNYDFSTGAGMVYGGNLGYKEIAPGIWGMFGGDGDSDGQVTNNDKNIVWETQSGLSGYYNGDFNLDSQVSNIDKANVWRPNAGKGTQVP